MKLKPIGDRVLIRYVEAEEKIGSIVIPDTVKEKPQQGVIEAVGDGKIDEKGIRQPMHVKQGDRVLFGKWSGTEVRLEGQDFMVLRESEILAVL